MVQDRGMDVYLARFDDPSQRHPEHVVPTSSSVFTGDANEVYIEAVDGERFIVVVDLLHDFDIKGGSHLRIQYHTEQARGETSRALYASLPSLHAKVQGEHDVIGRKVLATMDMKVRGAWSRCGFVFAPLQTDEDLDMDTDEVALGVDTHGKIVLKIHRGVLSSAPVGSWSGNVPDDAPDTTISSKAVVKDNDVSHAVKHVVLGPGVQPPTHKSGKEPHWAHIKEDRRNPVKFTIRFRSRDALQKLMIIPKDIYPYVVDLTDDSSPESPKIKLEDGVDEDDRSPTRPLDEDDRSPTQPLDGSATPDAVENASDGTRIKPEPDF